MRVLKMSVLEMLNSAKKTNEILKGKIINIKNDDSVIVKLDLGDSDEVVKGVITLENSTLYIPNFFKEVRDGEDVLTRRGKESLKDYLGATISFQLIGDIVDENGTLKEYLDLSMKAAKIQTVTKLSKGETNDAGELINPPTIEVNVLMARKDYLVVEYNGVVQTLSEGFLSYREIPSIKDYYRKNKLAIKKFVVKMASTERGALRLDRKPIIGNTFLDKVVNGNEYQNGESVIGTVIGKTDNGRLLIEVEPEILGLAYIPEAFDVKYGDEVKCTITGARVKKSSVTGMKRGKLLLSNIKM